MSKKWWYYWDDYDNNYEPEDDNKDNNDDYLSWGTDVSTGKNEKSLTGSSSHYRYYYPKYKSSLGWESEKTAYYYNSWSTDYNKSGIEKAELLIKIFRSIRDIVIILDFPFPVDIRLSDSLHYETAPNTRRLFIPTTVVDYPDSKYSVTEKTNILCGLGIHEAGHLKYTEYRIIETIINGENKFVKDLFHLLEDIRIEDKMLTERPGYVNFIESEKEYKFNNFKDNFNKISYRQAHELFLYNLIAFIRYPQEADLKTFSKQFLRIKNILSEMPTSTKDCAILAIKLFYEITAILDDKKLFFLKPDKIEDALSDFHTLISDSALIDDILYGADKDSGKKIDERRISKSFQRDSGLLSKLVTGLATKGVNKNTYIETMIGGNLSEYNIIKSSIQEYIPNIKKMITGIDKNYTFNIYGCRNGKLDENKLAEAYQGVSQVYVRQGKVTTNKTTVCILIDESGSMGCYNKKANTTRITLAKRAAVLLNEAIGKISGIDLFIYGHSADEFSDNEVNLRIYKEPGNSKVSKYSLCELNDRCQNRDGLAIFEVANRIRKFTSSNVLMFVISDGSPLAYNYGGWSAIYDTRDYVQKVTKMGFNVVQICIDEVRGCNTMFEHVISLEADISNLPKKLGQIVKKAIVADKKTTIT